MRAAAEKHRISCALSQVAALDEYLATELTLSPADDVITAPDLLASLPTVLDRLGERLGTTNRRVQGALFMWDYIWRIAAAAIACYLSERCAPDVSPSNVAFRRDATGALSATTFRSFRFAEIADCPEPGAKDAVVVSDAHALRAWLREGIELHVAYTVAALGACSPLGGRAQWALAADGCATAFLHVGKRLERETEACAEARLFLSSRGSKLRTRSTFFTIEHSGRRETFIRRLSCCLNYKVPRQDYCTTCPLLADAERERRVRAEMELLDV